MSSTRMYTSIEKKKEMGKQRNGNKNQRKDSYNDKSEQELPCNKKAQQTKESKKKTDQQVIEKETCVHWTKMNKKRKTTKTRYM